jgi:mycothiol synthase
VTLAAWTNALASRYSSFVRARGYEPKRHFWRMRIDMGDEPPAAPVWPDGITVRTHVPVADDRAVFEACEDSFSDHWGHVPNTFEWWMKRTQGETFDPSLWFLALAGDEIAGISLCTNFLEIGWVSTLGVRRPWRGRGLGEALLRYSFREFHRRGRRTVALGVDAQSLTGATRLYERAGMYVDRVYELSTKILRDGADLSTA